MGALHCKMNEQQQSALYQNTLQYRIYEHQSPVDCAMCGYNTYLSHNYSTPGPVSSGMGDRIGVQLLLRKICLSLTNHPCQLSLAILSWVGAMSTSQRALMLCDWGVKADMVLFAGNTV